MGTPRTASLPVVLTRAPIVIVFVAASKPWPPLRPPAAGAPVPAGDSVEPRPHPAATRATHTNGRVTAVNRWLAFIIVLSVAASAVRLARGGAGSGMRRDEACGDGPGSAQGRFGGLERSG